MSASTYGGVQILLGNGDGTFSIGDSYPTDYYPVGLTTGDFDGDGHTDFALSVQYTNKLEVFLGNGDGTFQPPVVSSPTTGIGSIAAGDFNGDGKSDLAWGSSPAVAISLSLGDGTFGPPTELEIGPNIGSLRVVDLDGDGALDLIAVSDTYVAIAKGIGDGTFNAANLYAVGIFANALATFDIDADGRLDIAALMENGYNYGAGAVVVLHQLPNGLFEDGGSYEVGPSAASLAAADFDGDGYGDLATANFTSQTVSVLFANGDGNLRATLRVPSPGNATAVVIDDFTSDARPDIATLNSSRGAIQVFSRGANGRFLQFHSTPIGGSPSAMAGGRFGSDSAVDLAITDNYQGLGILRGHGDGSFDPPVYYGNGIPMTWMAVADFNGDGNLDVAVVEPTNPYPNGQITVFLGQSDGTFVEGPSTPLAHQASGLVAANIDGGTRVDLATTNAGDNSLSVYIGFGTGAFQSPVDYATGPNPVAIAAGYLDSSSFPSLVVANGGASNVSVFFPDGGGGFVPQVVVGLGYQPAYVVVADLNGDGHPDVATVNPSTSNVSELLNNFDRTFKAPTSYPILANPMGIAAGPLFGTLNDLVVGDPYGDAFTILQNSHVSAGVTPPPPVIVNSPLTLNGFGSGFGPLTYQWRKDGLPLSEGGRFSGTTTPSLTISPVLFTDAASVYDLVVTDSCSAALSPQVPLDVEFDDVPLSSPFHDDILRIATLGITAGCTLTSYCPGANVSRAEMAVLLLKADFGADHVPPPPPPDPIFPDVPADAFAAAWIDELAILGVTAGCGNGNYCPDDPVTRGQMAVFLLKTLLGSGYVPPPPAGIFADVPADYFAIDWIEDLYNRGITAGCGTNSPALLPRRRRASRADGHVPREHVSESVGLDLPPALRDPLRLRQMPETLHRGDSQEGARRQRRERPPPADRRDEDRDQLDRDHRQQEADAGLDRQRGAHVLRVRELRHAGRELRGIGDDRGAPDRRDNKENRRGGVDQEPDREAARSADRHGDQRHRGAPDPVREHPRDHAPGRPAPDDEKRSRLGQSRRGASRGEARAQEDGNPGPHRVELPHVPEVSEVGQSNAPIAEDFGDLPNVQARRRRRVGTVSDGEQNDEPSRRGQRRDEEHVAPPVSASDRVDEVGRRLAERERSDEHAQRHAAPAPKPARQHLHPRGIHARQEQSRAEPEDDRGERSPSLEGEAGIGRRGQPRARGHQSPGRDDVGQIRKSAQQSPDDESELDGEGQPRDLPPRERPFGPEGRGYRGCGEPERHHEKLGQGDSRQRAPSSGILGAACDPAHPPKLDTRARRLGLGAWRRLLVFGPMRGALAMSCFLGFAGTGILFAGPSGETGPCPPQGDATRPKARQLNENKSRLDEVLDEDVDDTVTIEAMLEPGDDRLRWQDGQGAEITAYVIAVRDGGMASSNCHSAKSFDHDTILDLVASPEALDRAHRVSAVVTPQWRRTVAADRVDWSTAALRAHYLQRWVVVRGWLLFDPEAASTALNTAALAGPSITRATAWEIHPVTSLDLQEDVMDQQAAAPQILAPGDQARSKISSSAP